MRFSPFKLVSNSAFILFVALFLIGAVLAASLPKPNDFLFEEIEAEETEFVPVSDDGISDSLFYYTPTSLRQDLLILFDGDTTVGSKALADLFTVVAVKECGWEYESPLARNCSNYFGLRYVSECTVGKAAENSERSACYGSTLMGLLDLKDWVYNRGSKAPDKNLDFEELLTWLVDTRGFNPTPETYKDSLRVIRAELQKQGVITR